MISLTNIVKRYMMGEEEIMALAGVDLYIARNEYVALIGPSGSGKSTLMNLIGCLDQPSAGQYRIDGRDTVEMDSDALAALRRDRFGFIFQRYQLLPDLDAQANTEFSFAATDVGTPKRNAALGVSGNSSGRASNIGRSGFEQSRFR